jgi:hypothetical protein
VAYEAFDEKVDDGAGGGGVRFVVGLLVGALVVGAIWLGQWAVTSRDSADPDASSRSTAVEASQRGEARAEEPHAAAGHAAGADATSGDDEGAGGQGRDPRTTCQEVFSAQESPLEAAASSLGQWEIHVAAMNQLVAGTISLQQARRFWEQTRVGATRRLERFDEAMNGWRGRLARCPLPEQVARGDGRVRCARVVDARSATIRAASTSVETWRVHVHHMEMLRDGDISPAEATREWLASWRKGDRELRSYGQAQLRSAGKAC